MSAPKPLEAAIVSARRFVHCCYCCGAPEEALPFFTDGLRLKAAMQSGEGPTDGAILGLDGQVDAAVTFVYDERGPRTSPGIEVQAWRVPAVTGTPYRQPHEVGIQALGVEVPAAEIEAVLAGLASLGAAAPAGVGAGGAVDVVEALGVPAVTVRDRWGAAFDLVAGSTPSGRSQLHHLRVSCSDLERSVGWYAGIGFEAVATVEEVEIGEGQMGSASAGVARMARLRLPDEPLELVLHQWLTPAPAGSPYPSPNHRGFYRAAVAVDDTRDAVRRLEAAGRSIERPPLLVELTGTPVPDLWISFLSDPDGVPVELVERPRSAFR